MFLNRRKSLKEDAQNLFNNENFGFQINENENENKLQAKIETNTNREENSWAQWWKLGEENKEKIVWKTKDKIILGVELALVIYFMLWRLGLVPIF